MSERSRIGLEPGAVRLMDSQQAWKKHFQAEARRLRAALGRRIGRVEHIGSTAIADMPAKPIIDIMAAVKTLAEAEEMIPQVERLGYEWHPRDRQDVPDRLYFVRRTEDGSKSTHHLSLAEATSDFWRRQLLFRDYVRAHPEVRQAYAELKRDLAAKFPADRPAYGDAKTAFIEDILRRAPVGYSFGEPNAP